MNHRMCQEANEERTVESPDSLRARMRVLSRAEEMLADGAR